MWLETHNSRESDAQRALDVFVNQRKKKREDRKKFMRKDDFEESRKKNTKEERINCVLGKRRK